MEEVTGSSPVSSTIFPPPARPDRCAAASVTGFGQPAVDDYIFAGNAAGLGPGQKIDHIGHVFGLAIVPERIRREDLFPGGGRVGRVIGAAGEDSRLKFGGRTGRNDGGTE